MARENCNLDKDDGEILKPSSPSSASASGPPVPSSSPFPSTSSLCLKPCEDSTVQSPERPTISAKEATGIPSSSKRKLKEVLESSAPVRFSNRCSTCQKKVVLIGFRCRCGDLFCGRHRYSSVHNCSFDYKAFGRAEIAKANPVIRAAKIIKI